MDISERVECRKCRSDMQLRDVHHLDTGEVKIMIEVHECPSCGRMSTRQIYPQLH